MKNLNKKYRLSLYSHIVELSRDKVYIVKNSLDDKIYIKKILEINNYDIYKKLQELNIDNIPKIYEVIKYNEELIIIEEYINGYSLKEILEESGPLPKKDVINYTLQIIKILNKLHLSNPPIIHRDIKLSNIMVNNDGIVKLIDFDISRVHRSDRSTDTNILGTYGYAAPEQFGFNQSDARTDIYSLGITMNIMLVGKLPIEERYRGNLGKIISKCIELDPDKRYQDINELRYALLKRKTKDNSRKEKYNYLFLYYLPGINSPSKILRIISYIWYGVLAIIFILGINEDGIPRERQEDMLMVSFALALTLLYGNFCNIKSKLPIIKSDGILVPLLGYVLYTFLLFITLGILLPA